MQVLSESPRDRPRCTIYIDGFNLYFGVFEGRPEWKWLNLESFFVMLRRGEDVVSIKYFTAIVDPKKSYSEQRERQILYLKALGTLDKVAIIKGVYQPRTVRCNADCRQQYNVPEEKKTDVNIAVAMIGDCVAGSTDSIVLVSGDCDQEPAIKWIQDRFPAISITVYVPTLPQDQSTRRNDFYDSIGVNCRPLPLERIPAHQFNTTVKLGPGQFVQRPEEWK